MGIEMLKTTANENQSGKEVIVIMKYIIGINLRSSFDLVGDSTSKMYTIDDLNNWGGFNGRRVARTKTYFGQGEPNINHLSTTLWTIDKWMVTNFYCTH